MKNQRPKNRTVSVFKRIFDVKTWSDWNRMKSFTVYLKDGFKKFFVPQEIEARETFEQAKIRLNLSDKDLLSRQRGLLHLSILMVVFAVGLFIYFIYQLFQLHFLAASLSIIIVLIALVLAVRYHFWYFQIKKRKLGCTLREWYKQGLLGEEP